MLDFVLTMFSHRGPTALTTSSIEKFRMKTKLIYYLSVYSGDALLSRARSLACTHFLDNNYSPYILLLDDDIIFEPHHIEKIVQDMKDGYDLVGGAYTVRDGSQLASYGWDGKIPMDGKVCEIEYLATGFMGISRNALIKIRDNLNLPILNLKEWARCWPFFECGRNTERKGDPIYISEDWDFCEKARKAGIKTYLDTSVQLGHIGQKIFTIKDLIENKRKNQWEDRSGIKNLVEHAAEFLEMSGDTIVKHLSGTPSQNCCDAFTQSKLPLDEFYRKGSNYILYDLIDFNSNYGYMDDKLKYLEPITGKKILDYGCGIGTASIFMNRGENTVYGYDIGKQNIEFCNFRQKKLNLTNIEFSTKLPDVSEFDIVVAIDVFEHIENLFEVLCDLGKKMKTGARLHYRNSFDKALPVHIDHSEFFDTWLQKAGFIKFDEVWAIKT